MDQPPQPRVALPPSSTLTDRRSGTAAEETSHPVTSEPRGAVNDQVAAQKDLLDPTGDAPALEERIVDAAVVFGGADGPRLIGVEQHDVGVRSGCDGSLARVQ